MIPGDSHETTPTPAIAKGMKTAEGEYLPWQYAGGPHECKHGYARSIACPICDALAASDASEAIYALALAAYGPLAMCRCHHELEAHHAHGCHCEVARDTGCPCTGFALSIPEPSPAAKRPWWKLISKVDIKGCEATGDAKSTYMTRYAGPRLLGLFRPCVHVFHRSDADDLHDHPWNFISVILWRGYNEITETQFCPICNSRSAGTPFCSPVRVGKRKYPGMVLFRKAEHKHRVQLLNGKPAVTLMIMLERRREWGFFTSDGWIQWKQYFKKNKC